MSDQVRKAEQFRDLHTGRGLFVLPNAWDIPSARVFEDAGFPAVATSSAGVMVSLGYPDGETIPWADYLAAVERISSRLAIPLSVDVVAGFGATPGDVAGTVRQVIRAGAVGINIEDTDPRREQLFPLPVATSRVQEVVRLRESIGIPFVINGRTDAFRHPEGTPGSGLRDAIERCVAYRDAGADCVYPMGVVTNADIAAFTDALRCPTNVMVRRGLARTSELERLGVKRVSFGPGASYATFGLLKRISAEVQERGTYDSLVDGAISFDDLNRLASPRRGPPPPP